MSTHLIEADYIKLLGESYAENRFLRQKIRDLEHQHANDDAANRMLLFSLEHIENRNATIRAVA